MNYGQSCIENIFRAPRDELKQLIQSGGGLVSQQARLAQVGLLSL